MKGGMFIAFEGGEGAGKTTQANRLAELLTETGHTVTLTREPGGTPFGKRIRDLLLDPDPEQPDIPPMTECLLFAADRATHVHQVVRPALDRGEVVISDRYVDSSVAYQGGGRGLQQVLLVSEVATGFLQPDLVVLLDIDPAVGLRRAGRPDRIEREQIEFHQRARSGFLARATSVSVAAGARHRRYLVLDAAAPADTIAKQITERVTELLGAKLLSDERATARNRARSRSKQAATT